MANSFKARKGSVARGKPCKGPRDSLAFEKREWNGRIRRDGRRFCTEFAQIHATGKGTYARRQCPVEIIYNLRPWLD